MDQMQSDMRAMARAREEREIENEERRKARLIRNVITGAATFFMFYFALGVLLGASFTWILSTTVLMAIVGAGAGFIISHQNYGQIGGLGVGAALFFAVMTILSLVSGDLTAKHAIVLVFASLICGGIPGFFIGIHVENAT